MSEVGPEADGELRARAFPLGATKVSVATALLGIAASGVAFDEPRWGAFIALMAVAVCVCGAALRRSRAIVVGVDGLRIEGWRGARFVAYADLLDVKLRSRREGITLHTKRAVRIAVGTTFAGPGVEGDIEAAIRDALERWRATSIARERARGDAPRPPSLPALSAPGVAHYRVAAVPRERLLDVLEDPVEAIEIRVAAATALGNDSDDEDSAERMERVRDATASVDLRAAIGSRGRG